MKYKNSIHWLPFFAILLLVALLEIYSRRKPTYSGDSNKDAPIIEDLKELLIKYPHVLKHIEYVLSVQPHLISGCSGTGDEIQCESFTRPNYWHGKTVKDFVQFFRDWLVFPFYPKDPSYYVELFSHLSNSTIHQHTSCLHESGPDCLVTLPAASILFAPNPYGQQTRQQAKNILNSWIVNFMNARGDFIKTPASAKYINVILKKQPKKWNVGEVIIPVGGFKVWNDLFLRKFKPGMRPIASPGNPCIAISPAEGSITWIYHGLRDIQPLMVKGDKLNIRELLNNKYYINRFIGGTALDILLWFTNYHWFHSPVTGKVMEISSYPGSFNYGFRRRNWFETASKHDRVVIIYKTQYFGLVAMIPVGFRAVGGISITVKVGDTVQKGQPVGHFDYGGSSIILLFEKGNILITVPYSGPMKPSAETPAPVPAMGQPNPIKVNEQIAISNGPSCQGINGS